MQDDKAGIAVYSTSLNDVTAGDSIIITGALSSHNGQLQISPVLNHQLIASGINLPAGKTSDLDDLNLKQYESMRIILPCIGISTCESQFDEGWFTIYNQEGFCRKL